MVKGAYSGIIRHLKLSVGYQYLQYIHSLLIDQYFVLIDNKITQMTGNIF